MDAAEAPREEAGVLDLVSEAEPSEKETCLRGVGGREQLCSSFIEMHNAAQPINALLVQVAYLCI